MPLHGSATCPTEPGLCRQVQVCNQGSLSVGSPPASPSCWSLGMVWCPEFRSGFCPAAVPIRLPCQGDSVLRTPVVRPESIGSARLSQARVLCGDSERTGGERGLL